MEKYILYQPLHGLTVELHMLEMAMLLGELLDRTVVLPIIPNLETQVYRKGLNFYFNIPDSFRWISNDMFYQTRKKIDVTFRIIPHYKKEYNSNAIKNTHPVWLDGIHNSPYFEIIGYNQNKVKTISLNYQLDKTTVLELFETDEEVIAFSYINGLLDDSFYRRNISRDSYKYYRTTPSTPSNIFMDKAKEMIANREFAAVHWRRGMNMDVVIKELWKKDALPDAPDVQKHIPEKYSLLFLATDVDGYLFDPEQKYTYINHGCYADEPNDRAMMDMSMCILSDFFVGNYYSAFSRYIYHSRCALGKDNLKNHFVL